MLRESSYMDDHEGALAWVDVDGRRLLELTLTPERDLPVVYTSLVFQLQPDGYVPRRADYYDGDELTRSMIFDRVEVVSGRRVPMLMVLQPADEADERTEVLYERLEFDVALSTDLFTRRGLRREARG